MPAFKLPEETVMYMVAFLRSLTADCKREPCSR